MAYLLKRKSLLIAALVLLCVIVPGGILLSNRLIQPSPLIGSPKPIPTNIDDAVSLAIEGQSTSYYMGETSTEGHIILDFEEKNETVKVYTIASFGSFGFENGIFTKVSGSGAIPTVITFAQNENGEYSLLEYKEPMDARAIQIQ